MAKKEVPLKSILKDTLALFLITLVAGLALGYVYYVTKDPIDKAKETEKQESYQAVYKEAASFEAKKDLKVLAEKAEDALKEVGIESVIIDEALEAKDQSGAAVGLVMSITSSNAYDGDLTVALGVSKDGIITGVKMLTINETPGLGMKAKEAAFKDQYNGKKVESFELVKSGKQSDNQIDAISGATITSKAVTDAVNGGLYFVNNLLPSEGGKNGE